MMQYADKLEESVKLMRNKIKSQNQEVGQRQHTIY